MDTKQTCKNCKHFDSNDCSCRHFDKYIYEEFANTRSCGKYIPYDAAMKKANSLTN